MPPLGADRALGIALHAAGMADGDARGIELLAEAVTVLRPSPTPLELARALTDLGAAQRPGRFPCRGPLRSCVRAWTWHMP